MAELTASEYSNLIAEKDKEIAEAIASKEVVANEIYALRRKKMDLDQAMSKCRYNIDKLKLERSLLNHAFWNAKNQGL
jgi:hypothetical protein